MKIRFLGTHNAESRNTKLISLLIDDVIAVDAENLVSELSFTEQEAIKAILLSHGHYDHIRDVPAFVFNSFFNHYPDTTKVFASSRTLDILASHLLDGIIYPEFTKGTSFMEKPALELYPLEHLKVANIAGYQVLPMVANHAAGALGFEITAQDGKSLFYTGDTGPGLSPLWEHINPQILITDATFPNRLEKIANDSKHLCPRTLRSELVDFHQTKGYLPRVILTHVSPYHEAEIREEIQQVAKELSFSIEIAKEGDVLII